MTIIKESDYLSYNKENIDRVPAVTGVYALFDLSKRCLYVGSAGARRLRARIKEHWRAGEWPDVFYFRWFQADSARSASDTEADLIQRHDPKYNGW